MIAPTEVTYILPPPKPGKSGVEAHIARYVYESAAYRAARQREQVAAIMAALAAGATPREVLEQVDAAEPAEEQGDVD